MARKLARTEPQQQGLVFEDQGRTFTCTVAPRLAADPVRWWWFSVSDGTTHRYAPFVAADGDTDRTVQDRVVAYYDEHLARRAAPPVSRWRRPAT